MKCHIRKIIIKMLKAMPSNMTKRYKSLLSGIVDEEEIERLLISKFAKKLIQNSERCMEEVIANKKCMIITELVWPGTYFNIAILNNIMSLAVYALYKGCIPVIKINDKKEECFKWDWYFKQPTEILGINSIDEFEEIPCDKKISPFRPTWEAFGLETEEFKIWQFMYQKFLCMNQETEKYVVSQKAEVVDSSNMLGVLVRGTDYTTLKPVGHPKQPCVEQVIEKAKECYEHMGVTNIYVATEDKSLYDKIENAFNAGVVVSNTRTYYDEAYYNNKKVAYIGEIHFERDNDNYIKGIEYLTTLMILSSCKAIVAGNCGGTQFAVLYSTSYEYRYIFNEGFYGEE